MPRKRQISNTATTSQKRRVLRSTSSTHVVYCIHCDTKYYPLETIGCPGCSIKQNLFVQKDATVRPPRDANLYTDIASDLEFFPQFSKLPYDIRVMIWKVALSQPRVVSLVPDGQDYWQEYCSGYEPDFAAEHGYSYFTLTSNPLLYVCRETYSTACAYYTKAFQIPDEDGYSEGPQVLFNFDTDIMYLDMCSRNHDSMHLQSSTYWMPEFKRTKQLAILTRPTCVESAMGYNAWPFIEEWLYFFLVGGDVETVTIVHRRHPPKCFDNLVLIDIQDIEGSLAFYQQPYDQLKEREFISAKHNYEQQFQSLISIDFSLVRDYASIFQGQTNATEICDIPNFEHKIMTTNAMKTKLERARAEFEQKKAEYMERALHITAT